MDLTSSIYSRAFFGRTGRHVLGQKKTDIGKVLICALLIRLLFLAVLYFVRDVAGVEPYIIIDDETYDSFARVYMNNAGSVFDVSTFNALGGNRQLAPFWTWVVSAFAYFFRTLVAIRLMNIFLSVLSVYFVYRLTMNISGNEKAASFAMKLFAFLPYPVIICCFPIKDIFILFVVLFFFDTFMEFIRTGKLRFFKLPILAGLLVALYFARGAIVEMLLLICLGYLVVGLAKRRRYLSLLLVLIVSAGLLVLLWNEIIGAFMEKINDYMINVDRQESAVSFVQVQSLTDLYKLPLTYFFAMLQPLKTRLFSSDYSVWLSLLEYLNISFFPIAIGNGIYFFRKKENFLYWLSTTVVFLGIITISLGAFRHYLCMIPYHIINFSLLLKGERRPKSITFILFALSAGLFLLVFFYSVLVL